MRGRILVVVRLRLDDQAADPRYEQRHADEVGRNLVHRAREELASDHRR
jgi:hypothetical protein